MHLRSAIAGSSGPEKRWLWGRTRSLALASMATTSFLPDNTDRLVGRNVMLLCNDQLAAAAALIDMDGVAARILLCPPDVKDGYIGELAANGGIDVIVGTPGRISAAATIDRHFLELDLTKPYPARTYTLDPIATEWLLLTSGTSGIPKIVQHSLASLTAAITIGRSENPPIWSTFYDIRRYGGLQIFLRAMLGGGSMVLSDPHEPAADFLQRLADRRVTHISGTPSHWRRAIMSANALAISPAYVRMSGEIADQKIIDALRDVYPGAVVSHAFASTEAGVGFAVDDGREGFPAAFAETTNMKIADSTLRIRSSGAALRYIGSDAPQLRDQDGFVDTGDVVERRDDRYVFVGRRGGIINIGGNKVHPEEVEALINRHGAVRMSLVKARKSAVIGAIIVAEIVLSEDSVGGDEAQLMSNIMTFCRNSLPAHKVPAMIKFVPSLDIAQSGKIVRTHA